MSMRRTSANPRPPLRRLLLAALAGGLGVFGLGVEPAASAAQKAPASTLAATAAKQQQPGS
jgi:hypothetical protein